jgi:hypothetical protein
MTVSEAVKAEAYYGHQQWVNYFLHSGHLYIGSQKMSKSLKNFFTIREILKAPPGSPPCLPSSFCATAPLPVSLFCPFLSLALCPPAGSACRQLHASHFRSLSTDLLSALGASQST